MPPKSPVRDETFAEFLDRWLIERDINASQFARMTATNQSLVTKWRTGTVTPSDKNLRKMAPTLGKSDVELLRMAGRLESTSVSQLDPEHAEIESIGKEMANVIAGVPRQHRMDVVEAAKRIAETYRMLPSAEPERPRRGATRR